MRKLPLKQVICVTAATVLMSGCSTVVQQIQETTGNEIRKVEESKASAPTEIKSKQVVKDIHESPAPYTKVGDILQDQGQGLFASGKFNQFKVYKALDQMPIGLKREAAFQYLLGLLGENYKQVVKVYNQIHLADSKEQARILAEIAKDHQTKPLTPEEQTLVDEGAVQPNQILFLIDASGSMGMDLQGKSKMEWTKEAITQFAKTMPKGTQIYVRTFGKDGGINTKDPGTSCENTNLVYKGVEFKEPVWNESMTKLEAKVGWNPTGLAIQEGAKDLATNKDKSRENRVVLITDGVDNCKTNPEQQAEQLSSSTLHAPVNVVSLDMNLQAEKQVSAIAEKSGGELLSVKEGRQLIPTLQTFAKEIQQMNVPWQVRALEKSARTYQVARKQLKEEHQHVSEIAKNEQQHLQDANEYIFNEDKIQKTDYERIGTWINQRYDQMDGYIQNQYQNLEQQLQKDWLKQVKDLETSWEKTYKEGEPNVFVEKKTEILQDLQVSSKPAVPAPEQSDSEQSGSEPTDFERSVPSTN